jgi:hypothetical protein
MKPSLFEGLAAKDETTWCVELGREAPARLRAHWDSFVTREDFAWLAELGINALRIPLGHWIFGPPYPYHPKYGGNARPFVEGGVEVLDRALEWAREFGLRVLLDLHAAAGSGALGRDVGTARGALSRMLFAARDPGAERAALGRADGSSQGLLPPRLRRDPHSLQPRTGRGRIPRRLPLAPRVSRLHAAAAVPERNLRHPPLPVLHARGPRHGHPRAPAHRGSHLDEGGRRDPARAGFARDRG